LEKNGKKNIVNTKVKIYEKEKIYEAVSRPMGKGEP
jgi:hypothetical protein